MNDEARMTNDEDARSIACAFFVIRHSCFVIALLSLLATATPALAATDLTDPDAAVQAGRDALRSQSFTPWYDRQADAYRPINLPTQQGWNWDWLDWLFSGFSGLGEVLTFLVWLGIAVLAVLLVIAALRAWQQAERQRTNNPTAAPDSSRQISRVEALPVELEKGATDLLAKARQLAGLGDLKGAIVYLFGHQLVEADSVTALRLRKGKTNRQYLRELRRNRPEEPRLPRLLERTMLAFERAFFGDQPPTAEEFDACLAGAQEYDELLRTAPVEARGRLPQSLAMVGLLAVCLGCGQQHLNEVYGRRTGAGAGSVNGTSALGEMFKQAGHRVRSWRSLSPSLDDADVIVWFPHTPWNASASGGPNPEAVTWLDEWLAYSTEAKTLIYVGGDWQAGVEYWSQAKPAAPAAQKAEFSKRLREAKTEATERLTAKVERLECDWFELQRGNAKQSVTRLDGPFAEGLDTNKAALEHWSSLKIDKDRFTTLLADESGHPLVSELLYDASDVDWTDQDSRLILVENAGFLLNGALTNHERRKLAGRLVDRVGPPGQKVLFLETGPDPPIRDTDPNPRPPTGLELFGVWPVGAVLAQVAALFIVYACACWPIFGTPRRLRAPALTDFGRHTRALGHLLAATRDRPYAVSQLNTYFHSGPNATGKTPAEPGAGRKPSPTTGSAGASPSRKPKRTTTRNA